MEKAILLNEIKFMELKLHALKAQTETSMNILLHPLDISVVSIAPISLDIHDAIIVGTAIQTAEGLLKPYRW